MADQNKTWQQQRIEEILKRFSKEMHELGRMAEKLSAEELKAITKSLHDELSGKGNGLYHIELVYENKHIHSVRLKINLATFEFGPYKIE